MRPFLLVNIFLLITQVVIGQQQYILSDTSLARDYLAEAKDLSANRQFEKALEKARLARIIFENVTGPRTRQTGDAVYRIGAIYYNANEPKNALISFKELAEISLASEGEQSKSVASAYHNIGLLYSILGDYKEATQYNEKALLIRKRLFGIKSLEVASSYSALGNSLAPIGKQDLAIEYLEKAIQIVVDTLGENHRRLAPFYNNLGNRYEEIADYQKALENHMKSVGIKQSNLNEGNYRIGDSYNNIGNCYNGLKQPKTAIMYFNRAIDIYFQSTKRESPRMAQTYNNIGNSYSSLGEIKTAIEYYDKSLEIRLKIFGDRHPKIAETYNNIGNRYRELGFDDLAIEYHQKSLEISVEAFGEESLQAAYSYHNLGNSSFDNGDFERSLLYFQKALKIRLEQLGELNPYTSKTFESIGNIYPLLGKSDLGIEFLRKAFPGYRKYFGEEHPMLIGYYIGLGNAFLAKEELNKAKEYFSKALEIGLKNYGEKNLHNVNAYFGLGNALGHKKKYLECVEVLEKALQIEQSILGNKNPGAVKILNRIAQMHLEMGDFQSALNSAERAIGSSNLKSIAKLDEVNSLSSLTTSFQKKGNIRLSQHEKSKELTHLIEAKKAYLLAYEVWKYRNNLRQDDSRTDIHGIGSQIVICNERLKEYNKEIGLDIESFVFFEKSKAGLLFEAIQEANALQYAGIPQDLLDEEYRLKTEISYHEKLRQRKLDDGLTGSDTSLITIDVRLFDLLIRYDTLKTHFETNYPEYYRLKYDVSTVPIDLVQKQILRPDQTMVEYLVGDSSIFIFIVSKDRHKITQIKKDFPLDSLVQQMRLGLYGPYTDGNGAININYRNKTFAAERYVDAACEIYQKLIEPIETDLSSSVIIVPDGVLGYIPFQALIKQKSDRAYRFREHQYFGIEHQISYSYSATLLREMIEKEHRSTPRKSLLSVAPYYDGRPYTIDSIRLAELGAIGIADLVGTRSSMEPLPHSGEESQTIRKLWEGDILQAAEATEEKFTSIAENYRILHLATHGEANDKVGDFAYLAFSEIEDEEENELLYIKDIYNLKLNADLVVLSACQTGVGELLQGEGIISLARAFAYAGAKSIVMTLWSVNDRQTKDIMIDFHLNLRKGMNKDKALWKAQRKYLELNEGEKASPYYWAPFVGIGDMKPIG